MSAGRGLPGSLVLLRHGRTAWSAEGRFTGWEDPPLDDAGEGEARQAGRLLAANRARIGAVLTSFARRATRTAELALEVAGTGTGTARVAVTADWRLNERHLGELQGLERAEARERFGRALLRSWSGDRDARPPGIPRSDRRHPAHDIRYRHVDPGRLPGSESLAQLEERVLDCWAEVAEPILCAVGSLLIVSHCHTLRTLARHLEARAGAAPSAGGADAFAVTGSGVLYVPGGPPVLLGRSPAMGDA